MIKQLRSTITFFSSSTLGRTYLNEERKDMGIARGLEKIGKTRFATLAISAIALQRNLPPIRKLITSETVVIPVRSLLLSLSSLFVTQFLYQKKKDSIRDVNHLFIQGSHTGMQFEMRLVQYIKVLTPFVKSIACLESSQTNPADVYLFWLASVASLKRVLDDPANGIDAEDAGKIRTLVNNRFREILEEGPEDCYISAFFLDPREFFQCIPVILMNYLYFV